MPDATEKLCRSCGETKPRTEFYRDGKSADRLRYDCKKCGKAAAIARAKANPAAAKATQSRYLEKHHDRLLVKWRERRQRPDVKAKISDYTKRRYAADPARSKAETRAYMRANKDRINAAIRERYRTDRDFRLRTLAYNAARQRFEGQGTLTAAEWAEVWDSYLGLCVYCGGEATSMDHVVPFKLGGRHEKDNVVPACKPCNSGKQARPLLAFIADGGLKTARAAA